MTVSGLCVYSEYLTILMGGLIVPGILSPELQQLDAIALLQAADIPDMDCLDELLSQVPETDSCSNEPKSHDEGETNAASGRFAGPGEDQNIKLVQETSAPTNTKKSTMWAVNVWKDWRMKCRVVSRSDWPRQMFPCSTWELNWPRFILEVRRQVGKNYPPNTLYQLCCGVMCYVCEVKPELAIFKTILLPNFVRPWMPK